MDPSQLAEKARKSIGSYCFNECHGYCCRKSFIKLSKEQVSLMNPKHKSDDIIEALDAGDFKLDMGVRGCPMLGKNFKCKIHKNSLRPEICSEFPLMLSGKKVAICKDCPAVADGKLYPYLDQFVKAGYSIVYF